MIEYRELAPGDAHRLSDIDRSEHIDGFYRVEGGALALASADEDATPWGAAQLAEYVSRLRGLLECGGRAIGAWEGERLVGFASLDPAAVGGDPELMQLDMLYVSREVRRRGIGKSLAVRVMDVARALGATALYVSATPTRGTVEAYLRMGAVLLRAPDPVLFEREPEDTHMVLDLT